MAGGRAVHPDCRNASNPYHECSEYCFKVIIEAKESDNYRRSFVSCAKEDRISNLPEQLIASILERLTLQDAVRTSIISKKWRYRWTDMVALVFDEQFSNKFKKNGAFGRNGFIRIINKVLNFHKGPISKFHLHIPNMFLDSFEEVDQWMLLLSRNNVKELIIINSNRHYELPCYVYSCLELTKLRLKNCFFKPPLQFEIFLNLEELCLKNIDFGANLCGSQIRLPKLKTLFLKMCTNVYNFNIEATNLQKLLMNTCPDAILLRLLHSRCLTVFWIYFWKPTEDNVRVEKMTLAMMLSNLPKIRYFVMHSRFLKFSIAENIPKWLPHPVNSLEQLKLVTFQLGDMDELHGALCLLRNSPNLKTLCMRMDLDTDPRVDVGPASSHLESTNCLDCTLNKLQTVEITSLEGSRPQLLFIKLLLAHSPSLEKMTITPSESCNTQKTLSIAKNVMQFPRASPKAEMFYLIPEP